MLPIQALLILWTGIFWPPPRAMDQGTAVDKPITIRIVTDDQQPGQKPGLVIVEEPKSKGSASREGCQGCTLFTKVFKPGEGNPPRAAGQGRIQHFVIKACPEEGKAGAKPTHSEKKSAVFSKVFKFGGKGEADDRDIQVTREKNKNVWPQRYRREQ